MNPGSPHWPTFLWAVVAILIGLVLYGLFFGRKG